MLKKSGSRFNNGILRKYNKIYMKRISKINKKDFKPFDDIEKLIEAIENHYKSIDKDDLQYKKIKIKSNLNNYKDTSLLNYAGLLVSVLMASISTLISGMPEEIRRHGNWIYLLFVISMVGMLCIIISNVLDLICSNQKYKAFDKMCLDIIEKIEQDRKEQLRELEQARQESAVTLQNERKDKGLVNIIKEKIVKALK